MSGWRNDIAAIRKILTDTTTEGWRKDLSYIAQWLGHGSSGWRNSVRLIAQSHNVQANGWRNDIIGIAQALGCSDSRPWRKSLQCIGEHLETNPPAPPDIQFFLDELPRYSNTLYIILADGIIEVDKIIME